MEIKYSSRDWIGHLVSITIESQQLNGIIQEEFSDVSASNKKELLVQSFFNDQNDWQNVMRKKKLSDIARTDEHFTEKKDQFTEKKVNLHTDSNRKRV